MKRVTFVLALTASAMLLTAAPIHAADTECESVALFNGKDLTGWTFDVKDENATMAEIWQIFDGVLHCRGNPAGVLRTEKEYGNYVLELEWRWPERGGNNGVLVHTGEPRVLGIWPRSLEVQLQSKHAGDFWDIGTTCDVPNEDARRNGRRVQNLTEDSEKPLGEWNKYRIICKDDTVTVYVNGEKVNECTNLRDAKTDKPLTSGAICLQSEGTPIDYRNVKLTPLK